MHLLLWMNVMIALIGPVRASPDFGEQAGWKIFKMKIYVSSGIRTHARRLSKYYPAPSDWNV